jgi:hypothetical protein
MSDKIYDVTDLKEKISKLKEIQKSRDLEKQTLSNEVSEKEILLMRMKQDYTVLAPNEELRYYPTTTNAANSVVLSTTGGRESQGRHNGGPTASVQLGDTILDKDLLEDKRFRIWNEKMEMQILLQEIRPMIPILEKEVKYYEKETEFHKKAMIKKEMKNSISASNSSKGPRRGGGFDEKQNEEKYNEIEEIHAFQQRLLLRNTKEIQETIEKILNDIIEYKIQKKSNIEKQKQANQAVMNNMIVLRKDIQLKLQEKVALKKFTLTFQSQIELNTKRKEIVIEDFLKLRKECEENSKWKPYLWQTAVFKQETGKKKRISFIFTH